MSKPGLMRDLSRALVDSMVASGVTQEELLTGQIAHTDLPWQWPPLVCPHPVMGVPVEMYINQPTWVDAERLYSLWTDSLMLMRNEPMKVLNVEGDYRASSYAMPHIRRPDRRLLLSTPDGFPDGITDLAAVTLSMECVHLLRLNARYERFVHDESNYYIVLPSGSEIGVRNGLPIMCADEWDMSVAGMVDEMLDAPRGAAWEGCDYDIISKCRSVLYEGRNFPEREGIEWGLQALRIMEGRNYLLRAIQTIRAAALQRQNRLARLREAAEVANRLTMSDRARIETLRAILVPEVLTPTQFTKLVYSYSATPPVLLSPKVLSRLRESIDSLHEEETKHYAIKT